MPVRVSEQVTLAFKTEAPEESVTEPTRLPLVAWPNEAAATRVTAIKHLIAERNLLNIEIPLKAWAKFYPPQAIV